MILNKHFAENDPHLLWVAPGDGAGAGSFSDPFHDIERAVERVQPGQTIVLRSGEYLSDVTIQKSGTRDHPIRIIGESEEHVKILGSCWYLYDVSDMIIAHMSFVNSPAGSLSVVGTCERNRFANLSFVDCGGNKEASCTLFFGGSNNSSTIVEDCRFERTAGMFNGRGIDSSVAIMVSEGNSQSGEINKNHILRGNRFVNYGYAIMVGSGDRVEGDFGHIIERNIIDRCATEGILVKCGDTTVRNNVLTGCGRNNISILGGRGSTVECNRIVGGLTGIQIMGEAHTIEENCIIRCHQRGMHVPAAINGWSQPAENILVERNTVALCGSRDTSSEPSTVGIVIDEKSTCIIRKNLFYGQEGSACGYELTKNSAERKRKPLSFVDDNIVGGGMEQSAGCRSVEIVVAGVHEDNFENSTGYGATGWTLSPALQIPTEEAPECSCGCHDHFEGDEDQFSPETDSDDSLGRSMFFGDDTIN